MILSIITRIFVGFSAFLMLGMSLLTIENFSIRLLWPAMVVVLGFVGLLTLWSMAGYHLVVKKRNLVNKYKVKIYAALVISVVGVSVFACILNDKLLIVGIPLGVPSVILSLLYLWLWSKYPKTHNNLL